MARSNKFAEMVKIARESEGEEGVAVRDRGRPAGGKRSNPDYVTTTIFLRKDTKKKAATILLNREEDLSSVLERLLSQWVNDNLKM
jgi:hypothetical protein